jgi:hypothetical protein
MSKNQMPRLSSDVKHLLTEQGEHRLTEDNFLKLSIQLPMLCSWADRVPKHQLLFARLERNLSPSEISGIY